MHGHHPGGVEAGAEAKETEATHGIFPTRQVYNRGEPATCLTKPVQLKGRTQVETVRFIVVPRMTDPMVLVLE